MQKLSIATTVNISKHAFCALLVKLLMLTVGDDVFQQGCVVDGGTALMYPHRGPVWLTGHRAKRAQQMAVQLLFHNRSGRHLYLRTTGLLRSH